MSVPRYGPFRSAASKASEAARGASKKRDTTCELLLRRALTRAGFRRRFEPSDLPGRPDFVFRREQAAVFVDGDYWHGRNLEARLAKLAKGHNAAYWVAKIQSNVDRDTLVTAVLQHDGWLVLRYWETDINKRPADIASEIASRVRDRLRRR